TIQGEINYYVIAMTVILGSLFFYRVYQRQKKGVINGSGVSYMDWVKLHFWAVFTHPLLDSCTTYGTQLFQPFWDYRVAFNNVSVVDPAYTVPFLTFLIVASLIPRGNIWRKSMNWAGIAISSAYLLWSVNNKFKVNRIFEQGLERDNITYSRYMTSPTILNNILWYAVAEGKDHYYRGFYSLLDSQEVIEIDSIPKNHELLAPFEGERPIEVLKWFSNGYYIVEKPVSDTSDQSQDILQYYDIRFGAVGIENEEGELEGEFVFGFEIDHSGDEVKVNEKRERPENARQAFAAFFERIKGK
ncbi:MAG: metal-dependent hydrolase, partial [Saprospiraceae bacterium]|nr:metal-dependent hydrolase [Saprospiraceae bacterium]